MKNICYGLVALLVFGLAAAQEASLYGPGVPEDAAFIRVIHAVAEAPEATFLIGGGLAGERIAFGEASAYELVVAGSTPVSFELEGNTLEVTVEAEAGSFYSVALTGSGDAPELLVLTDEVSDNLARALVSLYNLSGGTLSLMTADGEVEVVPAVGFGEVLGVMVNPVVIDLGVFEDGELLSTLSEVSLAEGEAYSVLVFSPDQVTLVRAQAR